MCSHLHLDYCCEVLDSKPATKQHFFVLFLLVCLFISVFDCFRVLRCIVSCVCFVVLHLYNNGAGLLPGANIPSGPGFVDKSNASSVSALAGIDR